MNNRPSQLDGMITKIQDKLYSREPQLMQRLIPLMNRINNIKFNSKTSLIPEPFKKDTGLVRSKNYNQSLEKIEKIKVKTPRLRKYKRENLKNRRIRNFNLGDIRKLKTQKPIIKKISALPRDILWMIR